MANPTSQEWYMLALINRMRDNPQDELALLLNSEDTSINSAVDFFNVDLDILSDQWSQLSSVAPLAWSTVLNNSAETHNDFMIQFDEQSHNLPGEPGLVERMVSAGYNNWTTLTENIFAFSQSVFYGHAAFAIDWGFTPTGIQDPPGHRDAIMNSNYREVGIAITPENDSSTSVGPLVTTQHFGNRFSINSQSFLLGSVFEDLDGDNFYDPGEGVDDVTINITGINGTNLEQSLDSDMMGTGVGGYQIQLDPGQYQIDFIHADSTFKSENITLAAGVNQQIDAIVGPEEIAIDLVSTAFNVANDHVLTGEATVTFTLANQGSHDSDAFSVNVVYSDDAILGNDDDQVVYTINHAGLNSQQTDTESLTVQLPLSTDALTGLNDRALSDDAPNLGSEYISDSVDYLGIVIDVDDTIEETDELNNYNQGKGLDMDDITYFPWDTDGNGLVTPTDAIYVINRIGQSTSSNNRLADFDGNGSITPTDAIAAINRLGYSINSSVFEEITVII